MLLFTELFSSYGSHQCICNPGLKGIYPASRWGDGQECPHGLPLFREGQLQEPTGRWLPPWQEGNHYPILEQRMSGNFPCHWRPEDQSGGHQAGSTLPASEQGPNKTARGQSPDEPLERLELWVGKHWTLDSWWFWHRLHSGLRVPKCHPAEPSAEDGGASVLLPPPWSCGTSNSYPLGLGHQHGRTSSTLDKCLHHPHLSSPKENPDDKKREGGESCHCCRSCSSHCHRPSKQAHHPTRYWVHRNHPEEAQKFYPIYIWIPCKSDPVSPQDPAKTTPWQRGTQGGDEPSTSAHKPCAESNCPYTTLTNTNDSSMAKGQPRARFARRVVGATNYHLPTPAKVFAT